MDRNTIAGIWPAHHPWFQECGPGVQSNEIVAFDTDLIGWDLRCISRTWWIGDEKPRDDMVYAMRHAYDHIQTNMEMLCAGSRYEFDEEWPQA